MSIVSCSVYTSNLYRQIGNVGRVSTYTFNLCGCVLSWCIFIQPRLLNYNTEISSIVNGCFPPLLCILLELVLAGTVSSRRIRLFKWQCTIPSSPLGISNNPCYSTGIHNMFMNLCFCGGGELRYPDPLLNRQLLCLWATPPYVDFLLLQRYE